MRRFLLLCALLAPALANSLSAAAPTKDRGGSGARSQDSSGPETRRESGVSAALEAELAGKPSDRIASLRQRLEEAPDDPAAHWHLGEVRVGESWLPYSEAADQPGRREQLDWFQQERARNSGSVADLRSLARAARERKMPDEERAILTQLVALAPSDREARLRLGDVLLDGTWIPRESASSRLDQGARWSESLDQSGERARRHIERLRRLSTTHFAKETDPFAGWRHPDRLFALEQAIDDRGDHVHAAFIRWLEQFDCYEATVALARQAIFSEHAPIRIEATSGLKPRPREDYLHALVGSVGTFRSSPEFTWNGPRGYTAAMEWEGIDGISRVQFVVSHPIARVYRRKLGRYELWDESGQNFDYRQDLAAARYWKTLAEADASSDAPRTRRVLKTVSAIAGRSLQTPEELAAWWREADDREAATQTSATYESTWYVDRRGPSRIGRPNYREYSIPSCLAAGTPITTELGPRAMETIALGDRVLTQDVETGELSFKPVLGRTVREKAVLYRLRTAGDEIVCSQGHPFWINGIGWVQARSLAVGMPLHTVRGATEIESIEPAGEGAVYNLVVAEAHSYFVGRETPFLSHDVTPRQPTNALVPGLLPLWDSSEASSEAVSAAW